MHLTTDRTALSVGGGGGEGILYGMRRTGAGSAQCCRGRRAAMWYCMAKNTSLWSDERVFFFRNVIDRVCIGLIVLAFAYETRAHAKRETFNSEWPILWNKAKLKGKV